MIDEEKILKGIREALAQGWTLRRRQSFPDLDTKCGCALSVAAAGLSSESFPSYKEAGVFLGLTTQERRSFTSGFDNTTLHTPRLHDIPVAFEFGRRVRLEFAGP